jgi:hypothetical protein
MKKVKEGKRVRVRVRVIDRLGARSEAEGVDGERAGERACNKNVRS